MSKKRPPKLRRKVVGSGQPGAPGTSRPVPDTEPDTPIYTQAGTPWPEPDNGTGWTVTPGERMARASSAYQGDTPGAYAPGSSLPDREGTCCLCGGRYTDHGNNPQPLADPPARCCHQCNQEKVIPARLGIPNTPATWSQLVREAGKERGLPADDEHARIITAEGEHWPQPQALRQELVDALGNTFTPGTPHPTTPVADVLAAERYAELADQATHAGYGGGPELAQAGPPPPRGGSGTTAPTVRTAADVAELRNWMVRQWQPGGLYARATSHPGPDATGNPAARRDFVDAERTQLQRAALYWTAPAMVDLLAAVAPDIPPDVRPVDLVWPDPCGLVVFATPVYGTDSLGRTGLTTSGIESDPDSKVEVNAICWASTRIPDRSAPGGTSHCLSVSSYRALDFGQGLSPGDTALALGTGAMEGAASRPVGTIEGTGAPAYSLTGTVWAPLGRSDWPLLGQLATQDSWIPDSAWESFREDRQLVAALFTLLSDRQTLAATTTAPTPRPTRKRATRLGVTQPRDVVVVMLRQPKRNANANPDTEAPTHTHRWLVRAHPCWQPCGPGRTERKLIIRRAHVKGPPDAPLVIKTRVNAWVR